MTSKIQTLDLMITAEGGSPSKETRKEADQRLQVAIGNVESRMRENDDPESDKQVVADYDLTTEYLVNYWVGQANGDLGKRLKVARLAVDRKTRPAKALRSVPAAEPAKKTAPRPQAPKGRKASQKRQTRKTAAA